MPFNPESLGLGLADQARQPERSGLQQFGFGLQKTAARIRGEDPDELEAKKRRLESRLRMQQTEARIKLFKLGLGAVMDEARGGLPTPLIEQRLAELEQVIKPLGIIGEGSLIRAIRTDPKAMELLKGIMESDDVAKSEVELTLSTLKYAPEKFGQVARRIMTEIQSRKQTTSKDKEKRARPSLLDKFTPDSAVKYVESGKLQDLEKVGMSTKQILSARNTILDNATKQAAFELKQGGGTDLDPDKFKDASGDFDGISFIASILSGKGGSQEVVDKYIGRIQELMEEQLLGLPEKDANSIRKGFLEMIEDAQGGPPKAQDDDRSSITRDEYNFLVEKHGQSPVDRRYKIIGRQ